MIGAMPLHIISDRVEAEKSLFGHPLPPIISVCAKGIYICRRSLILLSFLITFFPPSPNLLPLHLPYYRCQ